MIYDPNDWKDLSTVNRQSRVELGHVRIDHHEPDDDWDMLLEQTEIQAERELRVVNQGVVLI